MITRKFTTTLPVRLSAAALLLALCAQPVSRADGTLEVSGAIQEVSGHYTVSWVGNTYGHGGDVKDSSAAWVQDFIEQMTVQPDGTCYTASNWDEGGRTHGIYKEGRVLGSEDHHINCRQVSIGGHVWTIAGQSVTSDDGRSLPDPGVPTALGVTTDGKLLVADNGKRKQILFYAVSGTPTRTSVFGVPGGIAADYQAASPIPAAIHSRAFGSGRYPPGVYHPLKLWGLTGVGEDSRGRLFVATSEQGSLLRCFRKDRQSHWIVDWVLENHFFVDESDWDPDTDGQDLYSPLGHFKMDYAKTEPGSEWSFYADTLDSYHFPEDGRAISDVKAGHEHAITSARVRTIHGRRFLFTNGMTSNFVCIYRFEPGTDRAVPAGLISQSYNLNGTTILWPPNKPYPNDPGHLSFLWRDLNGDGKFQTEEYTKTKYPYQWNFWIDSHGGIWEVAQGTVLVRRCAGLDRHGCPIYDDAHTTLYPITGIGSIGKAIYQEAQDRLVLLDKSGRDLDGARVFVVDHWNSGDRHARFVCALGSPHPASFAIAGDYVFDCGWQTTAQVWVTNLTTGKLVGMMSVPASMGGNRGTGWVDIGWGINALRRKNGEYLVAVEDDGYAKDVLYRWRPDGK